MEVWYSDVLGWCRQDVEADALRLPSLPRSVSSGTDTATHTIHIRLQGSNAGPSSTSSSASAPIPPPTIPRSTLGIPPLAPSFPYSPITLDTPLTPMVAGPIRTPSLSNAHATFPYLPLGQAVHSKKVKSLASPTPLKRWPLLRFRDMVVPLYLILQCTNHDQRIETLGRVARLSQMPKKSSVNDTRKTFAEFVLSGQLQVLLVEDGNELLTWKDACTRLATFSSYNLLSLV